MKRRKKNRRSLLNFLGLYTFNDIVKEREESNARGYEFGYNAGYKNAMEQKILASEALTEKENNRLMEVFVKFGIEICYDSYIGGLRIRKRDRIVDKQTKHNDSKTISINQ